MRKVLLLKEKSEGFCRKQRKPDVTETTNQWPLYSSHSNNPLSNICYGIYDNLLYVRFIGHICLSSSLYYEIESRFSIVFIIVFSKLPVNWRQICRGKGRLLLFFLWHTSPSSTGITITFIELPCVQCFCKHLHVLSPLILTTNL